MTRTEQQFVASIRKIVRAVDPYSMRMFESHGLTRPQLATRRCAEWLG